MFHCAFKYHDQVSLKNCLKGIRRLRKLHYNVNNKQQFMYRGNSCQVSTRCRGKSCYCYYFCRICPFPQPICLLKLKRNILAAETTTPCEGCHLCRLFRREINYERKREPCFICKDVPRSEGSLQQRVHCALHCKFRFGPHDKEPASDCYRATNNFPNKCLAYVQPHNVTVCHHARINKFLNKIRRKTHRESWLWNGIGKTCLWKKYILLYE